MIKLVLGFLLFLLVACEQTWQPLKNSNTINLADTACQAAIVRAQEELKKGVLVDYHIGLTEKSNISEYRQVMAEDYGIKAEFTGCIVEAGDFCYRAVMDSVIVARFGKDIFEQAWKKADSLFIISQPLEIEGKDTLYTMVHTMPEYPGGNEKLMKYLRHTFVESVNSKDPMEGRVFVQFVVEVDGTIRDCNIVKGVRQDIDKKVEQAMLSLPKWKPGEDYNKKKVAVQMSLPVKVAFKE